MDIGKHTHPDSGTRAAFRRVGRLKISAFTSERAVAGGYGVSRNVPGRGSMKTKPMLTNYFKAITNVASQGDRA